MPEAIKLLKKASKDHPTDTVAWQFLGLALSQKGDTKGARKALEKAINLRFFGLVRVLDTLIFQSNKYEDLSVPEREAFRQELVRRYQAAFESVDAYLQLKPKDTGFWRAQRDELSFYADNTNKPLAEATVFHAGDVTKRAIILRKPEPEFTEEARAHDTQGTIIVRMILAADGTVQHVLVLRALPDGLTENALKAARMIKFQPAIRDGHSVSSVVTIEYGFHIY